MQQAIIISALHLAPLQKNKKAKGHSINCWAGCFKLKHFRDIFSQNLFRLFTYNDKG
jgi:hypothetical protein